MYRQNDVGTTELDQSLARSLSPFEGPLQIILDSHRACLHRDVLDGANILGLDSRSVIGGQFLMTGQCESVSRSVYPKYGQLVRRILKSESPSLSPLRVVGLPHVRPTDATEQA